MVTDHRRVSMYCLYRHLLRTWTELFTTLFIASFHHKGTMCVSGECERTVWYPHPLVPLPLAWGSKCISNRNIPLPIHTLVLDLVLPVNVKI